MMVKINKEYFWSTALRLLSTDLWRSGGVRKTAIAVALLIACVWLGLEFIPINVNVKVVKDSIRSNTGCAFTFPIPRAPGWPLATFHSDGAQSSRLRLFENDMEFSLAHSSHADIRAQGKGRYSHWKTVLYFSASDCSSPITNGREYRADIPVKPALATRLIGGLALLGLISLLWRRLRDKVKSRLSNLIGPRLHSSLMPTDKLSAPLAFLGLVAFLISSSLVYLFYLWSSGKSVSLSVAGIYQVSDASMYWVCSNSLLDSGTFGKAVSEWCQRRSIYPHWLAGIVAMGGRTIYGTLIVQAAILSLALGLFIRQGIRLTGWVGGLLIIALFLPYFHSNAWALTMSENAGLVFGLAGAAFLLRAAELHSARWAFIGCALISIALNARAGAFFVLPMLILWGLLVARLTQQRIIVWELYAITGCAAGFVLQLLLVWAVGGDPIRSHGNFSYTLYGLSVGGLGWQYVWVDHPELSRIGSDGEQARLIYGWAFSNIFSMPGLFVDGVTKGLQNYLQLVAFGRDIPLPLSQFATFLWYLGWIPLWQRRHSPPYLLVGLSSFGVLLSAPLLATDGGARVFAGTLAFDAIQMSIGLTWIISAAVKYLIQNPQTQHELEPQTAWPDKLLIAMLALCFLVPFAYRVLWPGVPVTDGAACNLGEYAFVTRIGHESLLLDLTESGHKPDFMKGEVDRAAFVRGIPISAWYAPGTDTLTAKSILLGQQLDRRDIYAPGPYWVLSDQHLAPYFGKRVRICVSNQDAQELFGVQYRKLRSINIID